MQLQRPATTSTKNDPPKTPTLRSSSGPPDQIPHPRVHSETRASPVLLLPQVVLDQIFLECNPSRPPIVYLPPRRNLYPWILGHVCRRWREVLWNSSYIWNSIQIPETGLQGPQHQKVREIRIWEILNEIFTHTSAVTSLSIHWSAYDSTGISTLIKTFSHRFKGLIIHSSSHIPLHALLELKPGSLPHLAELSLFKFGSNVRLSTLLPPANYPRPDMPSLRALTIDGNSPVAPYINYFPLSQLTNLELSGRTVSSSTVHHILRQCSSMVTAVFFVAEENSGVPHFQIKGVIKSPIKSITLSPHFNLDWNVFLAPLLLPSLTTFSILNYSSSPAGLDATFSPAIVSLVRRSGCSLYSFSISYNPERLQGIEPSHPDITHLLQQISDLGVFASGYIAAPNLIRVLHGSLKELRSVSWRVEPEGLCTLLDLLDDRKLSGLLPRVINVICLDGEDFQSIGARFINRYSKYREEGYDITVRNTENKDVRFAEEQEKESDVPDEGSIWAAGLGGDGVVERSCCCSVQ